MRLALALVSFCIALGVARSAHAGDVEEGRRRFNRGVELFREADYAAAMAEFRRAYEVAPNYRVLFNIAQTAFELKDYATALDAFEQYLKDGGKDIPAARRKMVDGEIEKLKSRVSELTIEIKGDGAQISIDDVAVGTSPLAKPVRVSAGRRKIVAVREGARAEKIVEVAGGDAQSVTLEMSEAARETPVEPTPPPPTVAPKVAPVPKRDQAESKRGTPAGVWIGVAVTGALAAGATVTGVLALRSKSEYDDTLDQFGSDSGEIKDQRDRTRRLALITDVLAGAAVAAGAITVYIAVSSDGSKSKGALQKTQVGVGPRGIALRTQF